MFSPDLISVIVPLYNKEAWVERCIRSIVDQTYQDIEIIIVDDGSTDSSRKIIDTLNDPRIRIFDQPNSGVSSARNLGLEQAKGEFIAFIDADDEWLPRHLEVLMFGFSQFDKAVLVCNDYLENMSEDSTIIDHLSTANIEHVQYYPITEYIKTLSRGSFLLTGSSVLIKSVVIEQNRLRFIESISQGEDVNYWLRLSQYGDFVFSDYIGMIYHRTDQSSIMNNSRATVGLVAPFFKEIDMTKFTAKEQWYVFAFLKHEYYKKAFQNRGLPLKKMELSRFIGGVPINRYNIVIYLLIRYAPDIILRVYYWYRSRGTKR